MSESYYKVIEGKKYKRALLDFAEEATGSGGTISKAEAKEMFELIADGDAYTDVEKDTMAYIRKNYKFTDAADEWLRSEIRSWAAGK